MAVMKRNGHYYIYFRPFKERKIGLKLLNVVSKTEARRIEGMIIQACRTGSYAALDSASREACIRMFQNQGWEVSQVLARDAGPNEELTLWKASELFLTYPEIIRSRSRDRYEMCLVHLVEHFGKDKPIKSLWVPDIKRYQVDRLNAGASPSTVNWEKSTLSKVFQVLIEFQHVDVNPARLVKNLSQKSEERQVYLSFHDVQKIMGRCPSWFRPIIQTAYYTGMRRGEILGLTRKRVQLSKRMVFLGPENTKEGRWKRVPIRRELVSVLEESVKVACMDSERVFLLRDKKGLRPPTVEAAKNCWPRACEALDLDKPRPRFHDLRHTWRANARRSGVDPTIAESILGHWFKGKGVSDRYGWVSDHELVQAVDAMTFDQGDTEIIARR